MKKVLFILFVFGNIQANDLIYKHGFESTVLISGTASGLASTGLGLRLRSENDNSVDETISIDEDGGFAFYQLLEVGDNFTVSIVTLPNSPSSQSCELLNASGVVPNTGVDDINITCNSTPWKWDEMNWDEGGWQ